MADKKISQLDAAAALTGTEAVPIVQSGATVKTTVQDIANKASLGFTAENVANKSTATSLGASNTLYPTQNAVKVYADTVAAAAAAGKELLANKSIDTALGTSDTLYPSQNAVKVYVDGSVAGLLDDRGSYTPSVSSPGAYPSTGGSGTAGAIMKGDLWFVSASGFLGTTAVAAGATVRALVNAPGQTDANWNILSAGSISITTPNLSQVTTAGNTTANNITVSSDTDYSSITVTSTGGNGSSRIAYADDWKGHVLINNGSFSGVIRANNLTASRQIQLPNAEGTLALTSQVGLPYKVCVLDIDTNSSTWTIENTFQDTIGVTLTSLSGQRFKLTSTGNFTLGKVVVLPMILSGQNQYLYGALDWTFVPTIDDITIRIMNSTGTLTTPNSKGSGIQWILEVRVYP
jgi:hypothetical protein